MDSVFGKEVGARDALTDKEPKQTFYKAVDVAILRECLAGISKSVAPVHQNRIYQALSHFAASIREYCECEHKVFVEKEKKFACLNCGKRTDEQ